MKFEQVHPENPEWTCFEQSACLEVKSFFGFESAVEKLAAKQYAQSISKGKEIIEHYIEILRKEGTTQVERFQPQQQQETNQPQPQQNEHQDHEQQEQQPNTNNNNNQSTTQMANTTDVCWRTKFIINFIIIIIINIIDYYYIHFMKIIKNSKNIITFSNDLELGWAVVVSSAHLFAF